ncbi:uncharacterized protein [Leptinotarsa decemlineata]|uniref:uncharacterized protein n=1 Tax=Leptinotarsa decemlineata TaxID=7539 RepID=UPI003D30ADB9
MVNMATTKLKMDICRLTKDELIYELNVRGLGEGGSLTVTDLRKALRNALALETTSLAIKNPAYPYQFAQDSTAVLSGIDTVKTSLGDFSGTEKDNKYKSIISRIAHLLGRVNRSNPQNDAEKTCKSDYRVQLLLLFDELNQKVKRGKGNRDSVVFDISILRQSLNPIAHSSSGAESSDSASDSEAAVSIKPVPVRDWGLKFTGKPGSISICTFIEQVEKKRKSRGISRSVLFRDAVDLFEGDAYVWYNLVKSWASDWESLVELMRQQFLPPNFDRDLFDDIKRRTQGPKESIGMYVASMKSLFNKMRNPVAEEVQLSMILERVDPYYQPFLAFQEITSIVDLLKICRVLDEKRDIAKSYIPPPPRNKSLIPELAYVEASVASTTNHVSEISPISTTRSCYNCGQSGHNFRGCLTPRKKFCYRCGAPDVTSRECRCCSRSAGRQMRSSERYRHRQDTVQNSNRVHSGNGSGRS